MIKTSADLDHFEHDLQALNMVPRRSMRRVRTSRTTQYLGWRVTTDTCSAGTVLQSSVINFISHASAIADKQLIFTPTVKHFTSKKNIKF
jgi:hypothetical protein